MGRNYDMETYKKFLNTSASADNMFGLTEDQIVNWFVNQAGARPVMNSYGVNASNLKSTYIPLMKEYGVSPVFFLMYTVTEGGGAGNWINHYLYDSGSDGVTCIKADLAYLQTMSKTWYPVALTAPECPSSYEDNAGACQAFYETCGDWSIANLIMPSTMAGNAWVWCYGWCTSNISSRPPGCYFGNPYDTMIANILDMGGSFSGISGGGSKDPSTGGTSTDISQMSTEAVRKKATELITSLFKNNMQNVSPMFYANSQVMVQQVNRFLLKGSIKRSVLEDIVNTIASAVGSGSSSNGGNMGKPAESGGGQNNTPENVSNALNTILNMQGQGVGSGQCYALSGYYAKILTGWSCDYSVGGNILPLIGDGYNAHSIHTGWNWGVAGGRVTDYTGVNCPVSDIHAGDIFAMAPYQSYTGTLQWGHTGIIYSNDGSTIKVLEQNYAGRQYVMLNTYNAQSFANTLSGLVHFD